MSLPDWPEREPEYAGLTFAEEFEQWNDVTGALANGSSWYYECQSIVEDADKTVAAAIARLRKAVEALKAYDRSMPIAKLAAHTLAEIGDIPEQL